MRAVARDEQQHGSGRTRRILQNRVFRHGKIQNLLQIPPQVIDHRESHRLPPVEKVL
jgi:hypothetical protein